LGQARRDQPPHDVADAARRGGHHHGDGLARPRLRGCRRSAKQIKQRDCRQTERRWRQIPPATLRPAAWITLAHFSESFCRYLANSSGEPGTGSTTIGSRNFLWKSGSPTICCTSVLIFLITAVGAVTGAYSPKVTPAS